MSSNVRRGLSFLGIVLSMALLWEGYKWMGQSTGGVWPGTSLDLPVSPYGTSMPHIWDIFGALFGQAQRGASQTLLQLLLEAAFFTM